MKNRQGSTLVMVLMIFVVLSILATGTMTFMVSENKQSIYQKNKIEAYYIARSGAEAAEAAIMQMSGKEKEKMLEGLPKNVEIDGMNFENGNLESVILTEEEGALIIESKGKVGKSFETVEKVMKVNKTEEGGNNEKIEINDSVFGQEGIYLGDRGSIGNINGSIKSNGKIELFTNGSAPVISDNIFVKEEEKIKVKTESEWNRNKWLNDNGDKIQIYSEDINYSLPVFPDVFKTDSNNKLIIQDFSTNLNKKQVSNVSVINKDSYYKTIDLGWNESIEINAESDINIYVDDLTLSGADNTYNLKIIGDKEVNIFILNKFVSADRPIFKANSLCNINLYYYGATSNFNIGWHKDSIPININIKSKDKNKTVNLNRINGDVNIINNNLKLSSDGIVNGNICIDNGNVEVAGSLSLDGNIYTSVGNVTINGSGVVKGDIYTSLGNIEVIGSGDLTGKVYSEKGDITINGSGIVKGDIFIKEGNMKLIGDGRVVNGNLFINNGDVTFNGSSSLNGSIVSSAINKNVNLDGGGTKINGLIYSPKSDIIFNSSAKVYGAVVGQNVIMKNWSANIIYTKFNINTDVINTASNTESKTIFKSSYYK